VLLGLGASSALAGFALDRGLALAGGAVLLGLGLALALRSARACGLRGAARWRGPALMLAAFALCYALLGLLLPDVAARRADAADEPPAPVEQQVAAAAPAQPSLRRATLIIEKMICPPCASHVRSALKRDQAVRDFVAEEGNEQVIVVYDSGQTSAEKLARRFPASYHATLMSDVALP
jgi:hypothetical protein